MAKGAPKAKGRRSTPLLSGALAHSLDWVRELSTNKRVPPKVQRMLLDVLKTEKPVTSKQAFVVELSKPDGTLRPIGEVLREGPLPGRLPRPRTAEGKPLAPEPPKKGFTRGIDRNTSLEGSASELDALRRAVDPRSKSKVITDASEAAAQRLGFDVDRSGSALPSVFQFLYSTLVRQRVKAAKGQAGQFANLFSPLTEFALNNHPQLKGAEDAAVGEALRAMKQADPTYAPINYPSIAAKMPAKLPRPQDIPAESFRAVRKLLADGTQVLELLQTRRPAPGVLDIELANVRDSAGEIGWAVTDRLRGLLDLNRTPPEFTIVSIGEAKAQSLSREIAAQTVKDVERLLDGFRAPEGGSGPVQSFEPTRVKFGPRLVVAMLSEKPPPQSHIDALGKKMRTAFKSAKTPAPEVTPFVVDVGQKFRDARTIAGEFQKALNALAKGK
jgi:hypothetical protein